MLSDMMILSLSRFSFYGLYVDSFAFYRKKCPDYKLCSCFYSYHTDNLNIAAASTHIMRTTLILQLLLLIPYGQPQFCGYFYSYHTRTDNLLLTTHTIYVNLRITTGDYTQQTASLYKLRVTFMFILQPLQPV